MRENEKYGWYFAWFWRSRKCKSDVHDVIFNFDRTIGVDELGYLRGQLTSLIRGGRDKMQLCLRVLTLFVRIST